LLTALPRLRRLIRERASQEIERVQFDDGQETAIPRFPAQAIDEAVTNAFIHRDWQISRPVVVDQTPRALKIWSPGPL
ncbi:AAA family ATPase, partial [Corynebacterium sp. MSK041]|nr:AAA family ATPase [Corynebacterium sp. MSK041]